MRRYVEHNPMSATVVEEAKRRWLIPLRTLLYIVLNYGFKSEQEIIAMREEMNRFIV